MDGRPRGCGVGPEEPVVDRRRGGRQRGRAARRVSQRVGESDSQCFAQHSGDRTVTGPLRQGPVAFRRAAGLRRRLSVRASRRQASLGQEATGGAVGRVQREPLSRACERDVCEPALGLEALAGGALLRVDFERAAVRELLLLAGEQCSSGH